MCAFLFFFFLFFPVPKRCSEGKRDNELLLVGSSKHMLQAKQGVGQGSDGCWLFGAKGEAEGSKRKGRSGRRDSILGIGVRTWIGFIGQWMR